MWIVQLYDISRDSELANIVAVRDAIDSDDATKQAARGYDFRDGYTAVAVQIEPELETQEIFNRYD